MFFLEDGANALNHIFCPWLKSNALNETLELNKDSKTSIFIFFGMSNTSSNFFKCASGDHPCKEAAAAQTNISHSCGRPPVVDRELGARAACRSGDRRGRRRSRCGPQVGDQLHASRPPQLRLCRDIGVEPWLLADGAARTPAVTRDTN